MSSLQCVQQESEMHLHRKILIAKENALCGLSVLNLEKTFGIRIMYDMDRSRCLPCRCAGNML